MGRRTLRLTDRRTRMVEVPVRSTAPLVQLGLVPLMGCHIRMKAYQSQGSHGFGKK